MVSLRNAALLLVLVGCGGPEFDLLARSDTENDVTFTCVSGQFVRFPSMRDPDTRELVTPGLEEALGCLGLSKSCPAAGNRPGEANCQDVAYNKFVGTCMAEHFACYAPHGECSATSDYSLVWSSGHASYGDGNGGRFVPAGATDPCVFYEGRPGQFDRVNYLKERP